MALVEVVLWLDNAYPWLSPFLTGYSALSSLCSVPQTRPCSETFDGLRVHVHEEIVPMGVDPSAVIAAEGGRHATPEEFHALVSECMSGTGMF